MTSFRKIREIYLSGPDWIKIPEMLISGEYRSPTVMILSWLYAWYIRLFTLPGRMIVIITPLLFGYTVLSVRTPIRILTLTLAAMFAIDLFFGLLFRPRLRIRRDAPPRIRAGSEADIIYELVNRRRLPALDVEMDSYFRDKGLEFISGPAAVNMIPARGLQELKTRITARRRGLYTLPQPIADSRFPMALFKWSCRDGHRQKLHVYPAFHPLFELDLPVGRKFQREGTSKVSKVGESLDFAGCRDFRTGDDPRHIHWRSTARTGRLVVKEYQEEYLSRVAVIIDTYITIPRFNFRLHRNLKPEFPRLEAAVSLTAALADFLARGDFVIDFFAAGPEIYHFKGGRSLGCLDSILDILACIEPNRNKPLETLTPLVLDEIAGIGSAILVLLDWNEERRRLVEQLRRHGVALKLVMIRDGIPTEHPDEALELDPDDIFSGNVRRI